VAAAATSGFDRWFVAPAIMASRNQQKPLPPEEHHWSPFAFRDNFEKVVIAKERPERLNAWYVMHFWER